jgi:SulP family sulfate permease
MLRQKLKPFIPILDWLPCYKRSQLSGDLLAGIIVAVVLIPQSMAYAMIAGLPAQVGLYASLLPLLLYSLLGSSSTMAVGPVGLMSLMTGSLLTEMGITDINQLLSISVLLALLSGLTLLFMRLLRLGSIINFLSHPVISGFTSAAAILIMFSQLKHLLGIEIPSALGLTEKVGFTLSNMSQINTATLVVGLLSLTLLMVIRGPLAHRLNTITGGILGKSAPLIVVIMATLLASVFQLGEHYQVALVGYIPAGLPELKMPDFNPELWQQLLPGAVLIAVVGFLESISVAKALASRKREKVDANQELLALGTANIGSAFSGGYPVAGGLGRSMVNFSSGANTPLAGIFTALLIALALTSLTPYLYHLPRAVLSAIIIVAISALIDLKTFQKAWCYDRADAIALLSTFFAVLLIGIELGIVLGAVISISLYLHRSSQPHIAVVGRIAGSEHFRNVDRHDVETHPHILAVRVDENLYFANTNYLEDKVMGMVVDNPQVKQLILICSAINFIDSSALDSLEVIIDRLKNAGVTVHFAEVKGPVMDKLKQSNFLSHLGEGQVFLSTHDAFNALE